MRHNLNIKLLLDEFQEEYDLLRVKYSKAIDYSGKFYISDLEKTYKLIFTYENWSTEIKIISNSSRTNSKQLKYIERTDCFYDFEKSLEFVLSFFHENNIPTKQSNSVRFICDDL